MLIGKGNDMDNNGFNGFNGENSDYRYGNDRGFNNIYNENYRTTYDPNGYDPDGYDPNFNGGYDPRQYSQPVMNSPLLYEKEDKFYKCPGKEITGLILGIVNLVWGVTSIVYGAAIHALIGAYKRAYGSYMTRYSSAGNTAGVVIYGLSTLVLLFVVFVLRRKVYDQADIVTKKIDIGFYLAIVGAILGIIGLIIGVTG